MSRSRLLRRFVAMAAVGTLALLGPHMVLSSGAASGSCAMKRHGCGHYSLVACCCAAPSLPDATVPQPTTTASLTQALQPIAGPAAVAIMRASPLEARLGLSPTRGYTPTDLPVLLSTFLI
jgi:hypothetical protein